MKYRAAVRQPIQQRSPIKRKITRKLSRSRRRLVQRAVELPVAVDSLRPAAVRVASHAPRRSVAKPRGDPTRPQEGVFSTRSPHRPNRIGIYRVAISAIEGLRIQVRNLEALDGTPILDVKPLLGEIHEP